MPREFAQSELVGRILKALDKLGVKSANARQLNSVIAAANLICDEFDRDDVSAAPGMGLQAWVHSDATGLSSRYMASVLAPPAGMGRVYVKSDRDQPYAPYDPGDFGRCVGLLDAVPELRPHLPALASHGPVWAGLVAEWGELEALYREELPSGKAPKLCERIKAIRDRAEAAKEPT